MPLSCTYCCNLFCVNNHNARTVWVHKCINTSEDVCTYYFLLCVIMHTHTTYLDTIQWTNTIATHTHIQDVLNNKQSWKLPFRTLTLTNKIWPWRHKVWQTHHYTNINVRWQQLWQTHNTKSGPWTGRASWSRVGGFAECLSRCTNTHIQLLYKHLNIHHTHAQTFGHITHQHGSQIAMSLHTNGG